MAKLFANKFNLDQLPDPKKPKQDIQQGSTTVVKPSSDSVITNPDIQVNKIEPGDRIVDPKLDIKPVKVGDRTINPDIDIEPVDQGSQITDPNIEIKPVSSGDRTTNPNIRVEPVEPVEIETQKLNAKLREIDSQKNTIATSDEILESQGVVKSAAEQYVSRTRVEPFGETPVNQGSAEIAPPREVPDKVSNVEPVKVNQGSQITDPKIEIPLVDQGSQITDPNTVVQKIEQGDRIINPDTPIKLVNADERIVNPNIEVQKVKPGDRITDPKTPINPVSKDEFIVNPNTVVNKVEEGDRTVNPNTVIKEVKEGDRIVNPNTVVNKVEEGDRTVNPNTIIKKVEEGSRTIDPQTVVNKVEPGDRITNPNIKTVKVTPNELIVNPNIEVVPVDPNEKIVDPNIQPKQPRAVDPASFIPNNVKGIGVTFLFPSTISLKDRLKQSELGTTRHLPEFILSDLNTGYITITNPRVVEKLTSIDIQKVDYEKTILKQGGIDDLLRGIVSFINPLKYGDREVNQGSIEIKNTVRVEDKISPIQIRPVKPNELIVDPKIEVAVVEPGERTVNPDIQIKVVEPGERTINPNIQIPLVEPGERTIDPKTVITPIVPGDRITDPETKINVVQPGERTIDPETEIKLVEPGERTIDPKIKIPLVEPGERTIDPDTKINPVKPGERTFNPDIRIPLVEPGERTIDPNTVILYVEPGERTTIPYIPTLPFLETDDKLFFTEDPIQKDPTPGIVFPGPTVPDSGFVRISAPTAGTVFPGETTPQGSTQPVFVDQTGLTYSNQYNPVYRYSVDDTRSYLRDAADRGGNAPLLTKVYDVASATVIENKEVTFPPAVFSDPAVQGGYRALNYAQIQRRGSSGDRRNLDFTYEDGDPEIAPWRTRLGMPDVGADTINNDVDASATDFVTIKLESVRDGRTLQFRSYLKSFSDNYSAQYTDVNYVGRPDVLKVFKGTTRQLSLSFVVPVMSAVELKTVYQKLNELIKITSIGSPSGVYMQGPFVKLTVGGWCQQTPIVVNSLKFDTNTTEYTWDIEEEVPQLVDVSLDCAALSDNTGTGFLTTGTYITYGGA